MTASSLRGWLGRAHPAGNRHGRRTSGPMATSSVAIAAPAPRVMPPPPALPPRADDPAPRAECPRNALQALILRPRGVGRPETPPRPWRAILGPLLARREASCSAIRAALPRPGRCARFRLPPACRTQTGAADAAAALATMPPALPPRRAWRGHDAAWLAWPGGAGRSDAAAGRPWRGPRYRPAGRGPAAAGPGPRCRPPWPPRPRLAQTSLRRTSRQKHFFAGMFRLQSHLEAEQ